MQAAPLIMGHDLRAMTAATRSLLTNRAVIAIDQDPLGEQGKRIRVIGEVEIWRKRLANGGTAVAVFNRGTTPHHVTLLPDDGGLAGAVSVRDLYANRDLAGLMGDVAVASHGVVLLRVTPSTGEQRSRP